MTNQASPPTTPYNNLSMLVRFLLILAVSAFSALGFSSLNGQEDQLPGMSIAIKLASAAGIGLTAGYFTRVLLEGRRGFLRFMVNLGGTLAGMLVLGVMTGWHNGIGPLYYNRSTIDWRGLGLFFGAVGCSFLASLAYRKPLRSSLPSPESAESPTERPLRRSNQDTTPIAYPSSRTAAITKKKPAGQSRKRQSTKSKKAASKTIQKRPLSKGKKTAGTTVIRKKSSKKIVIAPVEVHRCPYCLEPVKRNDPRGVVECEVCHTLHHADCWAITGTCQVPHYNH
jgi:hypothetical protein